MQLSPPNDDKLFEKIVRDVCRIFFKAPLFDLYGRGGQKQDGIDGYHQIESKIIAFQCKQKDVISNSDSALEKTLKEEMEEEASKAQKFFESESLDVETYIFATTFKNSTHLQNHATKLSNELEFPILYWGWGSISEVIEKSTKLLQTYYPNCVVSDTSKAVEGIKEKTLDAASKVVESWKTQLIFGPKHLLELQIVQVSDSDRGANKTVTHAEICSKLADGGRCMLVGSPGGGKTTFITQVAENLLKNEGKVAVVVSLAECLERGGDILPFVTSNPNFLAAGVTNRDLALLCKNGSLVFCFDGWNEVPAAKVVDAGNLLSQVERDFPTAGIIVMTREHDTKPRMEGVLSLRFLPIDSVQRRDFIKATLDKTGDELLLAIENDPLLEKITRTPLILAALARYYEMGMAIPKTKIGILDYFVQCYEKDKQHVYVLQAAPLQGRAHVYLMEIAVEMTNEGRTVLSKEVAFKVITGVNETLRANGQMGGELPDPGAILNPLCDDHVLERVPDSEAVRFMHQQFQELYAARYVKEKLLEVIASNSKEGIRQFQEKIINIPVWDVPLKFIADEIREKAEKDETIGEIKACELGKHLVEWAIPLDRVFASELADRCGPAVRSEVQQQLETVLRKQYESPYEDHKLCALTGMHAMGCGVFADLFWPLIESDDQQVRLGTYHIAENFRPSCLGEGWKTKVDKWDEERRKEFVKSLGFNSLDTIEDFARTDPNIKVKAAAIEELRWYGAIERFTQILRDCNDQTFQEAIRDGYVGSEIPADLATRAIAAYQEMITKEENYSKRIRFAEDIWSLDSELGIELVKAELESYAPKRKRVGEWDPWSIVKKVAAQDPDWVSDWVVRKKIEGKLRQDAWDDFVINVPEKIIDKLLDDLSSQECTKEFEMRVSNLVAKGATPNHFHRMINEMVEILVETEKKEGQWGVLPDYYGRLSNIVRRVAWPTIIEVIVDKYRQPQGKELGVVLELLGRFGNDDLRVTCDEEKCKQLRTVLCGYISLVKAENDYSGGLKADFTCALAKCGVGEDVEMIVEIIHADIERRRKGIKMRLKGVSSTDPQVNGSSTTWARQHIEALCSLDREKVDIAVIELLKEPEYETDAGFGLIRLLRATEQKKAEEKSFHILTSNEKKIIGPCDEETRKRYAEAIKQKMEVLRQERDAVEKVEEIDGRLLSMAKLLMQMGETEVVPEVLEIMKQRKTGWNGLEVDMLEWIIKTGVTLETEDVKEILHPTIEDVIRRMRQGHQNTEWNLMRCIRVLAVTRDATRAVQLIKGLVTNQRLYGYQFREVAKAMGCNKSKESVEYLRELTLDSSIYKSAGCEIIKALASIDTLEAREVMIGVLENEEGTSKTALSLPTDYDVKRALAQAIADICKRDEGVRQRVLGLCENATGEIRDFLACIVRFLGDEDAVLSGLGLIRDGIKNPIPYYLRQAIDNWLIENIPITGSPGHYECHPRRDGGIRAKLREMTKDDKKRSSSALSLLGWIERCRLERGRPALEARNPNFNDKMAEKSADAEQENKATNKPNIKTRKILGDEFGICGLSINYKNLWHKIKNWPCVAGGIKKIRKLFRR